MPIRGKNEGFILTPEYGNVVFGLIHCLAILHDEQVINSRH